MNNENYNFLYKFYNNYKIYKYIYIYILSVTTIQKNYNFIIHNYIKDSSNFLLFIYKNYENYYITYMNWHGYKFFFILVYIKV